MNSMNGSTPYRGSRGATQKGDVIPKGYRGGQIQNYTPEQMNLFKQTFGLVSPDSYLSRLSQGDEELFNEMEAPAHRQFSESLGGIASKFSGAGSFGARRSSGFQNTTTAAASNFAQDLASRRQELQRSAITDLASISQMLLGQRPTEKLLMGHEHKPSFGEQALSFAGNALGGVAGGFGKGFGNQFGNKYFGD